MPAGDPDDARRADARRRRHRRRDRAGQLRADAPARALRQERHEGRSAVPRGEADHRRSRARGASRASSTARRRRRRTTSRRATRSATGGPARSSARTRSAACGAVRPTVAIASTIAASKTRVRAARQAARSATVIKRDLWEIGYKKSSSSGADRARAGRRRSSRRRRAARRWALASVRGALGGDAGDPRPRRMLVMRQRKKQCAWRAVDARPRGRASRSCVARCVLCGSQEAAVRPSRPAARAARRIALALPRGTGRALPEPRRDRSHHAAHAGRRHRRRDAVRRRQLRDVSPRCGGAVVDERALVRVVRQSDLSRQRRADAPRSRQRRRASTAAAVTTCRSWSTA